MSRGGARPGAGRPPGSGNDLGPKVVVRMAPEDMPRLDAVARADGLSRAAWVRRLVLAELRAIDRGDPLNRASPQARA